MALTREFIRKLAKESDVELPKEFIDGIIAEHTTTRDAYADEQVQAELAKQSPSAETVNVKDTEEYKSLKQSFDDYKAEIAAKEEKAAKEAAYRELLKDVLSDKGVEKAVKYADWNKIELEADGTLKDASAHIKSAKEEWDDHVKHIDTVGARTATPPTNTGGSVKTKEEIYKMENGRYVLSASERQAELVKLYQHEKGE